MSHSEDSHVLYELRDAVATVRLNRPDRLNALDVEMFGRLRAALDRAVGDGARALVVAGQGRGFCSGADLATLGRPPTLEEVGRRFETVYNPLIRAFAALPMPVVTAVNGPAVGAGCSLALLGDFVVAARSAYLQASFVNVGLHPDTGATWLIRHLAGPQRAARMLLLGERIGAEQAAEWGLIHSCVEDAALPGEADALARRLASGPTRTLGLIRQSLRAAAHLDLDQILDLEARNQLLAMASEDFAEASASIKDRGPHVFRGR